MCCLGWVDPITTWLRVGRLGLARPHHDEHPATESAVGPCVVADAVGLDDAGGQAARDLALQRAGGVLLLALEQVNQQAAELGAVVLLGGGWVAVVELHPDQLDQLGDEHVELHLGSNLDLDRTGAGDHGHLDGATVFAVGLDQVEQATLFVLVGAPGVGEGLSVEGLFVVVRTTVKACHAGWLYRTPLVGTKIPPGGHAVAGTGRATTRPRRVEGGPPIIASAAAIASRTAGGPGDELVAASVVAAAAQEEHGEGDDQGEDDGHDVVDVDEDVAGFAVHGFLQCREG